jgi:hypothetical protein
VATALPEAPGTGTTNPEESEMNASHFAFQSRIMGFWPEQWNDISCDQPAKDAKRINPGFGGK